MVDVVGESQRAAVRAVLALRVAAIARQLGTEGDAAVSKAASDPEQPLCQAINDRARVLSADDESLARIEQRWGIPSGGR